MFLIVGYSHLTVDFSSKLADIPEQTNLYEQHNQEGFYRFQNNYGNTDSVSQLLITTHNTNIRLFCQLIIRQNDYFSSVDWSINQLCSDFTINFPILKLTLRSNKC